MSLDLENKIRQYIPLGRANSKGWIQVNCKVCNDHGKKGMRGGFNFTRGLGYQCFNCEHKANFTEGQFNTPSDEVREVFEAFGIPDDIWNELVMSTLVNRNSGQMEFHKKVLSENTHEPKVIEIPNYFVLLSDMAEDDPMRQIAEDHLITERKIDPADYPYYMGVATADQYSEPWKNRLIIPIYNRNKKLIFYQGRDLLDLSVSKYKSCTADRDNVLYGMDQLYAHTSAPLFICEGFFDAYHVNGVAVMGKQITEGMIWHLDKSPREKIIIPDRSGDGETLALAGLKLGWKISTPDFGGCKDVTEAIVKYGKLYTMKSLMDNIHSGFKAEINLGVYCK